MSGRSSRRLGGADAPSAPRAALARPSPVANGVPRALAGVKVPTHSRTVYRRVLDAYRRDEEDAERLGIRRLTPDALPLVVSLFDNVQRRRKLAKALDAQERKGVLTREGAARQALDKLLALDGVILRQLDALGWTPTSLAKLGVNLVRLRDLAEDGEHATPEDIADLERRLLAHLGVEEASDGR